MKRAEIYRTKCIVAVAAALLILPGCTSLQQSNSIIQVQSSQNTGRAMRLTHAGIKALSIGAPADAMKKFSDAIAADETYGPAHSNLGLMHYDQGNLYQAILSFEQAMEFMPNDPTVYYNLALALESAGKTFEALDLYQQAVELDGTNPHFLGNLVRLRIRMGERDESVQAQLKDLIVIETRPEWRSWADKQLALDLNDALDRGPETPDFNQEADNRSDEPALKKVIDLTPQSGMALGSTSQPSSSVSGYVGDQPESSQTILSPPDLTETELLPGPIEGSNQLGPPATDLAPGDYFRD